MPENVDSDTSLTKLILFNDIFVVYLFDIAIRSTVKSGIAMIEVSKRGKLKTNEDYRCKH